MPGEGFQGPKCGAKTRSGGSCEQPAVSGGVRCRMHGGKALKGFAHPNYKHGRYSDYMPEKLLHGYRRQLSDRDLLHQRDEIAAIDSMIFESWKKMSDEESGALWKELRKAWREMEQEQVLASTPTLSQQTRAAHLRAASDKIALVGDLIRRGAYDFQVQEEILNLFERKRRLIESQGKREVQERLLISYEDASVMFGDLAEAVLAEVEDEDVLVRISNRFAVITGSTFDGPKPN